VPSAAQGGREPRSAEREARRPGARAPSLSGATAVLGSPRAIAFGVLAALLGAYYGLHAELPDLSEWGDVAALGLLVMPAVFALVYLALPAWRSPPLQLALVAIAFAILAILFRAAGLDSLGDFAKLAAMTAAAFWFLNYFETLSWVVIVAVIVPWVDAYSVWRGPTSDIVENHEHVFTTLSFAFPVPGENNSAQLGLPDLLFFALFLAASARFALRPRLTWLALVASFALTFVWAIAWDKLGLPALPLLALGFLLPNADLLWRKLLRKPASPTRRA
jgi:hypothetical protein